MEEQKILEMSNITKSFGPVEVLHGVQLNIKQSSVTSCWVRTGRI